MVLDVILDKESLSFQIDDPFHFDLRGTSDKITAFLADKGLTADGAKTADLMAKMIKGIAGCESGCPANAKELVSRGFDGYNLQYIEGGILSAKTSFPDGRVLYFKMFPEF